MSGVLHLFLLRHHRDDRPARARNEPRLAVGVLFSDHRHPKGPPGNDIQEFDLAASQSLTRSKIQQHIKSRFDLVVSHRRLVCF